MVSNSIDIRSLTLEELSGVVNIYPWYGGARVELCNRMRQMGALSSEMLRSTALYVGSRRILYDMVHGTLKALAHDANVPRRTEDGGVAKAPAQEGRRIFVAGGDYFSQAQYTGVRKSDDNIFSSFATKARSEGYVEPEGESSDEFCTETLAQIYLEQGYLAEAKKIYSKLSLRYPEKSAYFAALIDEINRN